MFNTGVQCVGRGSEHTLGSGLDSEGDWHLRHFLCLGRLNLF